MWDIMLLIVFIVIIGILIYLLFLLLKALIELVSSIFTSRKINRVIDGRGTISGKKYNNQNCSNMTYKETLTFQQLSKVYISDNISNCKAGWKIKYYF